MAGNKNNELRKYELTAVMRPELKQDEKEELLEKVRSWVKDAGGEVDKEEDMGIRELSYPIEDNNEALYHFFKVSAKPGLSKILEEQTETEKDILRYLLVRS